METEKAIADFLSHCKGKGLNASTIRVYSSHLRHLAIAYRELPTSPAQIDKFLNKVIRKKDARPQVKKTLGSFYKYLVESGVIPESPVPEGKRGRPPKRARIKSFFEAESTPEAKNTANGYLASENSYGGDRAFRVEIHVYIHPPGDRVFSI